ncbi:MAG: hypothetical protein A2231_00500 [Candidatus Firestonebacteria bacterium RIFOXYA2_FULL_40_8]|nr:MAG: hypothetical protein A2231_00500 [Candidatus Firestonebacteria bacterium RIFOXYA2_FULL_40_8]
MKSVLFAMVFGLLVCACLNAQAPETKDDFKAKKTTCPMTGAKIDITAATSYSDYNGVRYYFASPAHKAKFDSASFKYANEIITCAVCGTQENRKTRSFMEQKINKKPYFLCCPAHKDEFAKNPKRYLEGKDTLKVNIASENSTGIPAAAPQQENLVGMEFKVDDYSYADTYEDEKGAVKYPGAGAKFVLMDVCLKNKQMQEIKSFFLVWNLVDDKGYSHQEFSKKNGMTLKNPLQPEATIIVSLGFEIGKDRMPVFLEGKRPMLGTAKAICRKKSESKESK